MWLLSQVTVKHKTSIEDEHINGYNKFNLFTILLQFRMKTLIWSYSQVSIPVLVGLFVLMLGGDGSLNVSVFAFDIDVLFDKDADLGIGGGVPLSVTEIVDEECLNTLSGPRKPYTLLSKYRFLLRIFYMITCDT